jgi:Fur family peroxide stress response transcriptional regulator
MPVETGNSDLAVQLADQGLKVTPQRLSVLQAVHDLRNHPTADHIIAEIRKTNPHVATGTVYHVLDTLVRHKIIKRVKTDRDVMRYDGVQKSHHHLYCTLCDQIEDYNDPELDRLLKDYFRNKKLEGFRIEEFVLQIKGKFDTCLDS